MSERRPAIDFDAQKVDAVFAELNQCHWPGGAIGIAIGGRPVYRKGFGLASMELPALLSTSTRMRLGSTSKHFAAFAYMLLCEDGKASIDDTVGKHFPEVHPVMHAITMRQLMGNTGGHRDVHDICWNFSGTGQAISSAELFSLYRDIDDVNAAPGTAFIYNNGGWLMLSMAIERITGRSLEEVLRTRVFEPIGMYDTLLRRFDTDFVPGSATLHMTNRAGGFEKSCIGTALAGEGGIVSTADDMLRWLAHMDRPVIGSASTWKLMRMPQMLANGTSTGYGLGLIAGPYRGVETLSHAGGVLGGNAHMLKVPDAGLDIAIMVNRGDVAAAFLLEKILDLCLSGLDPIEERSDRPRVTGIFRSPTTGRVIQLRSSATAVWLKGQHQIASIDGFDMSFEWGDDGVLRPPAGLYAFMKLTLTPLGDRQNPSSICLSEFGNVDELIAAQSADNIGVTAIAGRYRSDSTGTDATIWDSRDGPRMKTVGRFGSLEFGLECLAKGIWRATPAAEYPPAAILSCDAEGSAFGFWSQRTRALPFRRCA